jgi:hypothetical protein
MMVVRNRVSVPHTTRDDDNANPVAELIGLVGSLTGAYSEHLYTPEFTTHTQPTTIFCVDLHY